MFYDKFVQICNDRGISPSKAAVEAGLSKSTVTKWKNAPNSKPTGAAIQKLTEYFCISVSELLGEVDDDSRALEKAKSELSAFISANPNSTSGQRLEKLFDYSGYDHVVVCFNLGIEQYHLNNWMELNELPPNPIVDKILGVFHLKAEDLLSEKDLNEYHENRYEWGESTKKAPTENDKRITDKYNIVKIAARNGNFIEKRLSDEDLAVITRIIDTLPDASDDL